MSTSVVGKNRKPQSSGLSSIFSRLTVGLLLLVGAIGFSIMLVMSFGRCTGEEFSASDFSRRDFYYFRIPLIKLQVTPIIRRAKTSLLVKHLQNKRLIPKNGQNWELASLNAGADQPYIANELILCRYLDQRNDDYDLRWLDWSQKNPKLARVFWPVIFRIANEDLYLLVPDLFQLARYAKDPVQLDAELRKLIIREAARIAEGELQLAHYDRAAQIAAFVLVLAGTNESWGTSIAAAAQSAVETQTEALKREAKPVTSAILPSYDPNTVYVEDVEASKQDYPDAEPIEPHDDTLNAEDSAPSGVDDKGSPDGSTANPNRAE
jgi:hypothetical protein